MVALRPRTGIERLLRVFFPREILNAFTRIGHGIARTDLGTADVVAVAGTHHYQRRDLAALQRCKGFLRLALRQEGALAAVVDMTVSTNDFVLDIESGSR